MTKCRKLFRQSFGLSDHTLNNNACLGAVALGASENVILQTTCNVQVQILCAAWMNKQQGI
jgi:hypothetical protein